MKTAVDLIEDAIIEAYDISRESESSSEMKTVSDRIEDAIIVALDAYGLRGPDPKSEDDIHRAEGYAVVLISNEFGINFLEHMEIDHFIDGDDVVFTFKAISDYGRRLGDADVKGLNYIPISTGWFGE